MSMIQLSRADSRTSPRRTSIAVSDPGLVFCVRVSRSYTGKRLTGASEKISSSNSLQDEELKSLLAQPLRAPKKKKAKSAGAEVEAKEEVK